MAPKTETQDAHIPAYSVPPKVPAGEAAKSILTLKRAAAWPLHRWPSEKRVIQSSARIHLPRAYLGKNGEDLRQVHAGTDLNQYLFRHYDQALAEVKEEWVNYVTVDNVTARRHEYLGPDPRVAGYFHDVDGDIHIQWWDGFLKDQWMGTQKWTLGDIVLNERGDWVEDI
ncbi:hypothetical protein FA95DRAFT_1491082 [Auriscalpium vulgare]|uniref:Uncharacterized protein n=1 Tax=Auriscalpium vulgare TaxID=40419 RepID=A0ACB8RWK2_9AGAM|nr:hypothetical protein FA95DRAFT_1491082 [Auriscalpium vulgare]